LTGESYAGHYVPAIGHRIWKANKNNEGHPINLQGLTIGNGWVDPLIQYGAYAEFALYNNLISQDAFSIWNSSYIICKDLIESGVWEVALEACQLMSEGILVEIGISLGYFPNMYDIRQECSDPPLCYDFDEQTEFMNLATVQKALGVNMEWEDCTQTVHLFLLGDWMNNLETQIPDMLESGIRVLVYSGMEDYICNWLGGRDWTAAMQWSGQIDFNNAPEKPWKANGQVAGSSKSADGLIFLKVLNAGHMVPMDQPANALSMLNTFLQNKPF